MTEVEDTIFEASDFQDIKIEKEETIFENITFGNEIKKEVEFEEEEYWPEEEANCDGNILCSFRKEHNSMTELEEKKFDSSDFPNIKFEKEETIFEKFTFENKIKEEMEFEEEDIWPGEKTDSDGNFPCSFREEKFPIRKDAVFAEISSSESHDAAKKEIRHKNDKQTGCESSVNNAIYFSSEKCTSDEGQNIEASSEYVYVSNDKRARQALLVNHEASSHGKEKTYKCTECDYATSRKWYVGRHINNVHRNLKLFQCSVCDHKFHEKSAVTFHIRSVHSNEKPFNCTECDYSSSRKANLINHVRSAHRKEKPFKCTECNYSGTWLAELTKHIRFVHRKEKPFKCTECYYTCSKSGTLTCHIGSVHKKERRSV